VLDAGVLPVRVLPGVLICLVGGDLDYFNGDAAQLERLALP
jgi:hypothetical protein